MRVGVDATVYENWRGFGRFARNVVGRLVELDTETTYVLHLDRAAAERLPLPDAAERRLIDLHDSPADRLAPEQARSAADLLRLARAASRPDLDAFLFPSVDNCYPILRTPIVVGLYDTVLDERAQEALGGLRARVFWRLKQGWALRRAARLFTLSEAARQDFIARFAVSPERIAVVPGAPEPVFHPRGNEELARELEPLGLDPGDGFLLYAGGIGTHKNLETLLEAYAALRARRGGPLPPLVLVGPFEAPPFRLVTAPIRQRIGLLGLGEDVRLVGYVSDQALACLYSAATAVVVTSFGEGFGLPAVEAASCGAPLVLSEIGAHREAVGDGALYFPPAATDALTAQLERLLDDAGLRSGLGRRAKSSAARFSWDQSARRLRELIADAAR